MKTYVASASTSAWIDAAIASRHLPWLAAVLLFCFPIFLFWQLLPAAANWVAQHVPVRYELPLGEHVLQSPVLTIKPSVLSAEYQASYRQRVLKLAQLADVQGVRVEFRAGWPNAYALPGNIMLLTDDLFSLMGGEGNEYLVDAIVAHELGHMKNRHIARKLVSQQLLTEVVLKMNGQSGQTTQVAGLANGLFLAPHFSRQHEAEADDFAFNLLQRSGQSPKYFSVAMQKFQFFQRAKMQEGSFTSSHPLTDSRIKAAHEAIDNSMVVDAYCKEDVSKKILNCTVEEFDGNRIIASHSYVKYTPNGQQ